MATAGRRVPVQEYPLGFAVAVEWIRDVGGVHVRNNQREELITREVLRLGSIHNPPFARVLQQEPHQVEALCTNPARGAMHTGILASGAQPVPRRLTPRPAVVALTQPVLVSFQNPVSRRGSRLVHADTQRTAFVGATRPQIHAQIHSEDGQFLEVPVRLQRDSPRHSKGLRWLLHAVATVCCEKHAHQSAG